MDRFDSSIKFRYICLVERTFKEIQSIISDSEPKDNRKNVKADMTEINKDGFDYMKWAEVQIQNCQSLNEKILIRTSAYFTGDDDVTYIYNKFEKNVKKHLKLLKQNKTIPDEEMDEIFKNMKSISIYVQPFVEVAGYIDISPESTPEGAIRKVKEYMREAKKSANAEIASQWHAIGRLADILMHRG